MVAAHPDDLEFGCGGTVANWCRAGSVVTVAVVTDGSLGSHDIARPVDDIVAAREREQREGGAVLGVDDLRFLGFADGSLAPTEQVVSALTQLVVEAQPQIVVTHDPWKRYQLHGDHRAVGEAVVSAVQRAREPRLMAPLGLVAWKPDELWFFAADRVNHVVDISASADVKIAALLCHRSQLATSMAVPSEDDTAALERFRTRVRGRLSDNGRDHGYAAGEAFHRLRL